MPHLFTNRERKHHFLDKDLKEQSHELWEKANALTYILGGILFVIGSCFFLPKLHKEFPSAGAWVFFGGSILYLLVVLQDYTEVIYYWKQEITGDFWKKSEIASATFYIAGTLLFVTGSMLFLPSVSSKAAPWLFIIGSFLFIIGAFMNVFQIQLEKQIEVMQLKNLIAINFILGSLLFLISSIPYLWKETNIANHDLIYGFCASLFIAGSVNFLIGGVLNYKRIIAIEKAKTRK